MTGTIKYRVYEIFGPTVQGEGPLTGKRTHFVRFAGCPLRCIWCDTPYAVLPEVMKREGRIKEMTPEEIVKQLKAQANSIWVTLSGGDPVMWNLEELVHQLHEEGYQVAVETQGTIWADWLMACDKVVVSPKPPSSGMQSKGHLLREYTNHLSPRDMVIKVVCFNESDYEFAKSIHLQYIRYPLYLSAGTARDDGYDQELFAEYPAAEIKLQILQRLRWLTEHTLKDELMIDVTVGAQQHVLLWGEERGV